MKYYFRRTSSTRPGCSSMTECIQKGEGCPMYTKLIVSTLMAILLFTVMEMIGEQMVKHKFDAWGHVMVVTDTDDHIPRHEYDTKLWVKIMNIVIGSITFFIVYKHLSYLG